MVIRQATSQDLMQVAKVHIQCFPDSFSTHLGKSNGGDLQRKFYLEYYNDAPELFYVAEDDTLSEKKIIGFCMGYYLGKNEHMKNFFKHNFFKICIRLFFLLIIGDKTLWSKIKNKFRKAESFEIVNKDFKFTDNEAGDLLSICVLSEYRGSGVAHELIDVFQKALRSNNKKVCLLSVAIENKRGVNFYERNKFVPYKEIPGKVRTYIKKLK